mgnify:FL=1
MVLDTSVLIALLFNETHSVWAAQRLNASAPDLFMSTVNLTETLIILEGRQPRLFPELRERAFESGIRFVPPTPAQAVLAASARLRFPLNLGDCFAYALAKDLSLPLLTLDRDFRRLDIPVVLPKR